MVKKIICILLFLFQVSCTFTDEELKEGWWKYSGGYHVGDVIDFKIHHLSNDTIYMGSTPKALLLNTRESVLDFGNKAIIIKDLKSDKKGIYNHK